jgi:hypothetical protein
MGFTTNFRKKTGVGRYRNVDVDTTSNFELETVEGPDLNI